MLHLLPAAVATHIASYLPIQSLHHVLLVSREWHDLLADHEQGVYRNAAILHRFVLHADLEAESSSQKPNNRDWKQFCVCPAPMQLAWSDHLHR